MVKKIIIGICLAVMLAGCFSSKPQGVPPIFYDYCYKYNACGVTNSYRNHDLISSKIFNEHKHEFVNFDYR